MRIVKNSFKLETLAGIQQAEPVSGKMRIMFEAATQTAKNFLAATTEAIGFGR